MTIKTQLTEKDFIKASFVVTYQRLGVKLITGFSILAIIFSIFSMIFKDKYSTSISIVAPITILILFPLLTYFSAKKNFGTNKRISEPIEFYFEQDSLSIKGESFSSQQTWDKIYEVTRTKNWIFIWQNRQIANPLPRKEFSNHQLEELNKILKLHKVANNL